MLSILLAACSAQTSVVVPLQENGLEPPPPELALTAGPMIDVPEATADCAWPEDDPGDLVSTGAEPGDVADDMTLWDQCTQPLSTWDLYGRYVAIYVTTFGCDACDAGAKVLQDDVSGVAERVGVEVLPIVAVRDKEGIATARTSAFAFAERLDLHGFPVAADAEGDLSVALPWDGATYPAWCVLAPDMTIVGCAPDAGGTDEIEEWIMVDAADR